MNEWVGGWILCFGFDCVCLHCRYCVMGNTTANGLGSALVASHPMYDYTDISQHPLPLLLSSYPSPQNIALPVGSTGSIFLWCMHLDRDECTEY